VLAGVVGNLHLGRLPCLTPKRLMSDHGAIAEVHQYVHLGYTPA